MHWIDKETINHLFYFVLATQLKEYEICAII